MLSVFHPCVPICGQAMNSEAGGYEASDAGRAGNGTTEVYGNVQVSSAIYERKDCMIQLIRS